MNSKLIQSIKYFLSRYILRKKFLIGKEDKFGSLLRFKIEDVVGRRIYKRGHYESDLSNYLAEHIHFENDDIALDIGANIGWYSLLLNKLMPESGRIFAFEPDPLNYGLLSDNIKLNNAKNIISIKNALSNEQEVKKLYRYSNKNLGRHSLLDINKGDYIEVETIVLDQFLEKNRVDYNKVKFAKIDIEGYEYFALLGASKLLDHIKCIISEFIPAHMIKGGVNPASFINLLKSKNFSPNILKNGRLTAISSDELLGSPGCDIIWYKD